MAWTLKFALRIGLDANRLRFRQHGVDEMAHYAQDCWDLEVNGSYGWIECVGIAHRSCHDLQSHERCDWAPIPFLPTLRRAHGGSPQGLDSGRSSAGPAFRADAPAVRAAVEALAADVRFPTTVEVEDGRRFTIEAEHVKSIDRTEVVRGTWFLPHVIEPAFGIDRLIWHLLDHAYDEQVTEEGTITKLRLHEDLAPYDVLVAPLFTKDGMDDVAMVTFEMLLQILASGPCWIHLVPSDEGMRADEIGIPWSVTIDHQTLEDETVTIRRRDDQVQVRVTWSGTCACVLPWSCCVPVRLTCWKVHWMPVRPRVMVSSDWTERHRPTNEHMLEGNEAQRRRIRTWLESWELGVPERRGLLLVGPPGVGEDDDRAGDCE